MGDVLMPGQPPVPRRCRSAAAAAPRASAMIAAGQARVTPPDPPPARPPARPPASGRIAERSPC